MRTVIGSYGTPPRPLRTDAEFGLLSAGALAIPGVDGLELPYIGSHSPWQDPTRLGDGRHVLTTVPATMTAVQEQPRFGLASPDEDARRAALRLIDEAREFVEAVNSAPSNSDPSGRARIETVQLHSAPGAGHSTPDAFARSLDEIASWEWHGADLAIEHCDAFVAEHPPAKGFLTLEQEIAAAAERDLGIVINWGRSVIETRTADGAVDHIAAAAAQGSLTGVIFSGCAAVAGAYGDVWEDRHLPIRDWGAGPLSDAAEASLLSRAEVERCVRLALQVPGLQYFGVKVKAPAIAEPTQWLDVVAGNFAVLTETMSAVGAGDSES
ncbi:DUF4862 family protein [Microbacterium sp. Bi121]|uniref:DUF4862 family protein n=1 Tax=Microbacterium sp. Bi121 TaxID=2822348 RepID=UPI001DD59611|nr:DUF4862 family protein [Microbacterium sp. Bi121]CAH0123196.1 hypothetical protein SRABI121_00375 [Microbacterium sp. Bi121]